MKSMKQNGNPVLGFISLIIIVSFFIAWPWNVYKLANCDFESNYKCEFIHSVGLVVPPLSIGTVWFDDDSGLQDGRN